MSIGSISKRLSLLQTIDSPGNFTSYREYEEEAVKRLHYYLAEKWDQTIDEEDRRASDAYDRWRDEQLINEPI